MTTLVMTWDEWCLIAEKVIANENPTQDRLVNGKPAIRVYLTTTPQRRDSIRYQMPPPNRVRLFSAHRDFDWHEDLDFDVRQLLSKTWPGVEFVL